MSSSRYRIKSAADLWDSYELEVNKDGYVSEVSSRNDIIVGSKFSSLVDYWKKFEGENAYIIEQIKDEQGS